MFRPDRLRRLIEKEGLSNNEFAKRINYSPATVSRLLQGHIGVSSRMLETIVQAFPEYSLDYFFEREGVQ